MGKKKKKLPIKPDLNQSSKTELIGFKPPFPSIKKIAILGSLVMIYILVYLYIFDPKVDLNGDNLAYYQLGKSMAEGHGFSTLWEPGYKPHNHFPPGYPALIACVIWLGSDSIILLKAINGILLALSIVFFYLFLKRLGLSDSFSYFIGLNLLVNYHLLRSATIMMSEIPFLFFASVILYLMTRIDFEKKFYRDYALILVIILLGGLFYIRVTALSALLGVLLFYIFRKKIWHAVLTLFGFAALILPWVLNSSGNTNMQAFWYRNPYQPALGTVTLEDLVYRFFANIVRYVTNEIPSIFYYSWSYTDKSHTLIGWGVGLLVLGFMIYGLFRIENYRILIIGYLTGTFGISLFWPEAWFGVRFINSIIPLIIFLFFYGIYQSIKTRVRSIHPVWLFPLLIFSFSGLNELNQFAVNDYPSAWKSYIQMAEYCKANLPDSVVIATRKPTIFYHFSGRHSLMYAFLENDQEFLQDLKERNVDYVVVDRLGYSSASQYLIPAIQKNEQNFQPISTGTNQMAYLLRFIPPYKEGELREKR